MSRSFSRAVVLFAAVLAVASSSLVRDVNSSTPPTTTTTTTTAMTTMTGTTTMTGMTGTAGMTGTTSNTSAGISPFAGANGTQPKNASGNSSANGSSNSSSCFPSHATVTTFHGAVKRMDELVAGDRVHVGHGQFSEVFMFTHKSPDVRSEFIVVTAAASGSTLHLSPGHYMYVNGALKAAKEVVVGDFIELANGDLDTVAKVSTALFDGLYNPQTLCGDIIVDGVRVSTYTTAVEPTLAHAVLSPLRAVYRVLGWSTASLNDGSDLSHFMPAGPSVC